jgi:FMN phosphatase YigB (HAD superfamily)
MIAVNKEKIILTDVDGVLLDWNEGFSVWMEHHGYRRDPDHNNTYNIGERYNISRDEGSQLVRVFNESAAIGFLPPERDAQYFVKMLVEKYQYRFLAVTSLSTDPYAKKLRVRNLSKLFGDNAFVDVICLDTGADKDEILSQLAEKYRGNWWIEDKPENVDAGLAAGFRGLLVEHKHNMNYTGKGQIVTNWEEICNVIVNSARS